MTESINRENCSRFTFHFPLTGLKHSKIVKHILKKVKEKRHDIQLNEKRINEVIKDIVFNMLIGYISPAFYPLILMNFVSDGMGSIMKLTAAVVIIGLKANPELRNDKDTFDWKAYTRSEINIFKILKKAFKMKFERSDTTGTSSANTENEVINYIPHFEGASSILANTDDVIFN